VVGCRAATGASPVELQNSDWLNTFENRIYGCGREITPRRCVEDYFPQCARYYPIKGLFSRLWAGKPSNFINKTKTNPVLDGKIGFGQLIA